MSHHPYYDTPRDRQRREPESVNTVFAFLQTCERVRFRTEHHRVLEQRT